LQGDPQRGQKKTGMPVVKRGFRYLLAHFDGNRKFFKIFTFEGLGMAFPGPYLAARKFPFTAKIASLTPPGDKQFIPLNGNAGHGFPLLEFRHYA
jgi:hypothetical protein